jgi:hypothetical protein
MLAEPNAIVASFCPVLVAHLYDDFHRLDVLGLSSTVAPAIGRIAASIAIKKLQSC